MSDDLFLKENDSNIIQIRRKKLEQLKCVGIAYPNNFSPNWNIKDLYKNFEILNKEALCLANIQVKIAGRMMLKRIMGKSSFVTIQTFEDQIQFYIDKKYIGDNVYQSFKNWDLGDLIATEGILFKTNKGQLSIRCQTLFLLAKSLRALPNKFHGLTDQEIKYRYRYIDLIVSKKTRQVFLTRSKVILLLRQYMQNLNFIEVETPMLHPIPGGATAKPFVTHHNTLNTKMFLRIAPELYLKRLIIGGFERVFEINRNFRNEGISIRHNPEFTMMEFYAAYTDYQWMLNFTEEMIRSITIAIHGTEKITYQNKILDLSKPFQQLTITQAIVKYAYLSDKNYTEQELENDVFIYTELKKANKMDINLLKNAELMTLQFLLFEEYIEKHLWDPTYIVNYPVDISPLTRKFDKHDNIAERFELFIAGQEIANGFSELNDPEEQENRFKKQLEKRNKGDDEAMFYDEDFIFALEYGMPPAGGCGIGIDRLIMLLVDVPNIRDVILFPQLKKRK